MNQNGHKPKTCKCAKVRHLSPEASERIKFELGRETLSGWTVEHLQYKARCPHGNVVYTTVVAEKSEVE